MFGIDDLFNVGSSATNFVTSLIQGDITRRREDNAIQRRVADGLKVGINPLTSIGAQGASATPQAFNPLETQFVNQGEVRDIERDSQELTRQELELKREDMLQNYEARYAELQEKYDELSNSSYQSEADRKLLERYQNQLISLEKSMQQITKERDAEATRANRYKEKVERDERVRKTILGQGDLFSWSESSSSYGSGGISAGVEGMKGGINGSGGSSDSMREFISGEYLTGYSKLIEALLVALAVAIGAGLEDLGKGHRSQVGTCYSTSVKGPRYLELAEGYITEIGLDKNDEIIGYRFVNFGKMMDNIKKGMDPKEAIEKASGKYGRIDEAVKVIDPREE